MFEIQHSHSNITWHFMNSNSFSQLLKFGTIQRFREDVSQLTSGVGVDHV